MKRWLLIMMMVLLTGYVFSQATPNPAYRIADATTAFGVNLPIGTIVYVVSTNQYYVATAGIASTATVTTASASLSKINRWSDVGGTITNRDGADVKMANGVYMTGLTNGAYDSVLVVEAGKIYRRSVDWVTSADLLWEIVNTDTVSTKSDRDIRLDNASQILYGTGNYYDKTMDAGSKTADSLVTWNPSTGQFRRIAPGSLGGGTVTSVAAGAGMDFSTITTTGSVVMGTPSTLTNATTNSASGTTHTHALDVGIADDDIVTVDEASGATAGEIAVWTANGIKSESAATLGIRTPIVETFEVAASGSSWVQDLAQTPVSGTVSVQLNGLPLTLTTQFTIVSTDDVSINIPVYQYDRVEVHYSY